MAINYYGFAVLTAQLFQYSRNNLIMNLQKMKPSEKCKAAGLKSLAELSQISGESVQTLINWSRNKPKVFKLVLLGAVEEKRDCGS